MHKSTMNTEPGCCIRNASYTPHEAVNIALTIEEYVEKKPYAKAVISPTAKDKHGRTSYAHVTYKELNELADRFAHGFVAAGITRGTKTIVMMRPSIDFFGIMLGLSKVGAVPVLVDPGMGLRRMLHCHQSSGAEAFIGISIAHVIRVLAPGFFKTVRATITVGRRWFWGGGTAAQIKKRAWEPFTTADTKRDELAMIAFTTGSTGPAKGVCYTHGMIDAQLSIFKSTFNIREGDVGLATFPAFALIDCGIGATSVLPDMDPTKPAKVNPVNILEPIEHQGVTYMFASPALIKRVAEYGEMKQVRLPSLRLVLTGGAPVAPRTIARFKSLMSNHGEICTPYGATEGLPLTSIPGSEILTETRYLTERGNGVCIGTPVDGTEARIIRISDEPIPEWSDSLLVDTGEIGEIVVRGPQVSAQYFNLPKEDAIAKIRDGDSFWHRTGDVGKGDVHGRLWMCGRKKHGVAAGNAVLYTIPCEAIFNQHTMVARSALVGVGPKERHKPVICIELVPGVKRADREGIRTELLELARSNRLTEAIDTVLFHDSFPVDIRHNAKIFREKLAQWAEGEVS